MEPVAQPHVIVRHCDSYDPERIRGIVREGLRELGLKPHGRVLAKPNLVAAGELFPHAHTRAEFAEGVLRALQDEAEGMTELVVGERCGITMPTRLSFAESGFDAMLQKLPGVRRSCFEEETQVEVRFTHPRRLRDYIFVPEPVAKADFFVNMPKFKAHPWTTVTFSMKNYIGIQDDRHRLIDHDHRLNEKVADLQHVLQPQFIAIDGIVAGQGRMLTPEPFDLGLIVMGNSQPAFDAVCCSIIGVEARDVEHIRLAEEHGFGTIDLAKIKVTGDVTPEEARKRARGFKVGLVRVEKYFEGSRISAYAGPPPEPERTDYCWGGCPGAVEEAIEIIRRFDTQADAKMPRLHVVFGAYRGPIPAKPGEKVVFIGDCADWEGRIGDRDVRIPNVYRDRSTYDPHDAKAEDIYYKMVKVKLELASREPWVRLRGCPVSVAEQVLAIVSLAGLKNPYFDPRAVVKFNRGYVLNKAATGLARLRGVPYQKPGACPRGEAEPHVVPLGTGGK